VVRSSPGAALACTILLAAGTTDARPRRAIVRDCNDGDVIDLVERKPLGDEVILARVRGQLVVFVCTSGGARPLAQASIESSSCGEPAVRLHSHPPSMTPNEPLIAVDVIGDDCSCSDADDPDPECAGQQAETFFFRRRGRALTLVLDVLWAPYYRYENHTTEIEPTWSTRPAPAGPPSMILTTHTTHDDACAHTDERVFKWTGKRYVQSLRDLKQPPGGCDRDEPDETTPAF
jgi:hypothetical protein